MGKPNYGTKYIVRIFKRISCVIRTLRFWKCFYVTFLSGRPRDFSHACMCIWKLTYGMCELNEVLEKHPQNIRWCPWADLGYSRKTLIIYLAESIIEVKFQECGNTFVGWNTKRSNITLSVHDCLKRYVMNSTTLNNNLHYRLLHILSFEKLILKWSISSNVAF